MLSSHRPLNAAVAGTVGATCRRAPKPFTLAHLRFHAMHEPSATHAPRWPRSVALLVALAVAFSMLARLSGPRADPVAAAIVRVEVFRGDTFAARAQGVAITPDRVLTVWHGVQGGDRAVVRFASGSLFEVAGIVNYDAHRDLVVLQLLTPRDGPTLSIASETPEVGAMASHSRFTRSPRHRVVPSGPVLAVRTWPNGTRSIEFEFDAVPGLSGSPLLNAHNQVIGLAESRSMYDTAYFTATGGFATDGPLRTIASVTSRHEPAIVALDWHQMGIQSSERREWLEAIKCFETAVMYDARDWKSMHLLAALLVAEGQLDEGLAWRKRLVRLMPDAPEMWSLYAIALLKADRREEAIAAAQHAEELCPWRAVGVLEEIRAVYERAEDWESWQRVNQTIDGRLPGWDPMYRNPLTRASRPTARPGR
jgi:Trypsin-like peptidase domain